jgi:hypothetical protein
MKKYCCTIVGEPFNTQLGELRQWQILVEEARRLNCFATVSLDAYGLYVESKSEEVIDKIIDLAYDSLCHIDHVDTY